MAENAHPEDAFTKKLQEFYEHRFKVLEEVYANLVSNFHGMQNEIDSLRAKLEYHGIDTQMPQHPGRIDSSPAAVPVPSSNPSTPVTNTNTNPPPVPQPNTSGESSRMALQSASLPESSQSSRLIVTWNTAEKENNLKENHKLKVVRAWVEPGQVAAADWSQNGVYIAVAVPGQVLVREVESAKVFCTLKPDGVTNANMNDAFRDVSFTSNGSGLVSVGSIGIKGWNLSTGKIVHHQPSAGSYSVSAAGPSGHFATGDADCIVRLWKKDFKLSRTLGTRAIPGACVRGLHMSSSGTRLLAGSDDASLTLWDVETGRAEIGFPGHTSEISSVNMSMDEKAVVSADLSGSVRLWDVRTNKNGMAFKHEARVHSVVYGYNNRWVLFGGLDRATTFWDLRMGARAAKISNHPGSVVGLVHSARTYAFLEAEGTGHTRIWTYEQKGI